MLPENQIDVGELENILRGLFEEDINPGKYESRREERHQASD